VGRSLRILFLTALLMGCDGSTSPTVPSGFVNKTEHSDADLWAIWSAAQRSLASKIDLNPLQPAESAPPEILPGDPRALSAMPHQLAIAPQPDVSSSVLAATAGIYRADPTGLVACPQPCNVGYTTAYSRYHPPAIKYAASWESSDGSFRDIIEYEFENQILFTLGYNLTWR
jgi:hypothetical protein